MTTNNPSNDNKKPTDAFERQLNDMILMFFSRPHAREMPPRMPEHPVRWIADHFRGMESVATIGVIYGLVTRGATPKTCGRYAFSGDVELPFQGCEQAMFNTMIAAFLDRGYDLSHIARLFEVIALIVTNITWMAGLHPDSACKLLSLGGTRV